MKRLPITLVAAMLVAAVTAPAQDLRGRRSAREGHVTVRAIEQARYRAPVRHAGDAVREHGRRYPARHQTHGYWTTVTESVLVEPGHWHTEHVPPTYGWIYDACGHRRWGVVDPGGCRQVWCPPRYETRTRRVWVGC